MLSTLWKLGIATAFTLQKAGHHVLLVESSDGRSRVSVRSLPTTPSVLFDTYH
jgi:glycine/D-amino acid oxidase-like deaminating enzyme